MQPEWATRVVSPAYDSLTAEQRHELMEREPHVFLHVTRSASPHHDKGPSEILNDNAAALDRLLEADVFGPVRTPALYLYRLVSGDHQQVGVVADLAVNDDTDNHVLPHERTRPSRTTVLADHVERVQAHSSAVALTHESDPVVDALVQQVVNTEPLLDFAGADQLGQTIWQVPDTLQDQLLHAINQHIFYIVDGHHRMAAAHQYRQRTGRDGRLLVAIFPSDQLKVLAFHRRVTGVNEQQVLRLVQAIADAGMEIVEIAKQQHPQPAPGSFGLYANGQWFLLRLGDAEGDELDAALLQRQVLEPLLGLRDGADPRLQFLPGQNGLERLVADTDSGGGVVFALHPLQLEQLMKLVDSGETLPPKSTYFQPKVRSGVFLAPR